MYRLARQWEVELDHVMCDVAFMDAYAPHKASRVSWPRSGHGGWRGCTGRIIVVQGLQVHKMGGRLGGESVMYCATLGTAGWCIASSRMLDTQPKRVAHVEGCGGTDFFNKVQLRRNSGSQCKLCDFAHAKTAANRAS